VKLLSTYNSPHSIIGVLLLLFAILGSPVTFGADQKASFNPDDIVAELKPKLNLNEKQEKDLTAALTELASTLDELIAKREAAEEDEDPRAFIDGVKKAQADYQEKLKGILSSSQLKSYNDLREKVIMDAMKDLSEIRLLDIQPHVGFSDDQLQKLIPVMAESMRGFMKIAWKYAGERLRIGQKIRVGKDLKSIQSDAQKQVKEILTEDQLKKWNEFKQQQQSKQKAA